MRTIVITGASRRLGLYLTQAYLAKGDMVFAITRSISSALAKLSCTRLECIEIGDYTARTATQAATALKKRTTHIDLLVHNASIFCQDSDNQHCVEDIGVQFDSFFRVHMLFPHSLTTALVPLLLQRGVCSNDVSCAQDNTVTTAQAQRRSVVIHMTDIYANNPKDDYVLYSATKAGLANLTKGLAKQYAQYMRVMAIAPGALAFLPEHTKAQKQKVLAQALIQQEAGFTPVLQAIECIYTNEYLTGSTLYVDGGRSVSGN